MHLQNISEMADQSGIAADDPPPAPPERPGNDECCNSGCNPCIFDRYEEAMTQYREALRIWEARRAPTGK